MLVVSTADPKEMTSRYLSTLRGYATRILVDRDILTPREEEDKICRMQQYLELHASNRCTQKEAVTLLYRGFFR